MANNRMFIHCIACDTYEFICSHLAGGWNLGRYDLGYIIDKHNNCFHYEYDNLEGEIFEFKYENSMSVEEWQRVISKKQT